MRTTALRCTLMLGLWAAPGPLAAQQPADPPVRAGIDSLLVAVRADTLIEGLGARFMTEIMMLVPDLTAEQRQALADATAEAFAPAAVREDVLSAMVADAPPELVSDLLVRYRSGAVGEMARTAAAFEPRGTVNDFVAGLGTPPTDRLQLMVQLAELEGQGVLDMLLGESMQESAHRLLTYLGGNLPPFERMTDEGFEAAYRDRAVRLGLANLHRLEPVSDDLVRRAAADLASEAGRWYANAYAAAVIGATSAAAGRVAALTVVGQEGPEPPMEGAFHCQAQPCLVWVDWEGPEPDVFNLRFGAPGALGARVMDNLGSAGFQLGGGPGNPRFTVRLVPGLMSTLCDFMAGTDSAQCQAIDRVRVEFRGRDGELPNPAGFTVLNRCGSDGVMDVDGMGAFVAARLLHALYRPSDPPPPTPRC